MHNPMEKILVTGATGLLGSEVVKQLLSQHSKINILTTRNNPTFPSGVDVFQGDLRSGEGLPAALDEVTTIIHCASNPRDFQAVDITGTTNLLNAVKRLIHFVYISIAGIEKTTYPYYVAKHGVEKMIQASGLPYTILRTTQFHPFILNLIKTILDTDDEVTLVPDGMRFQSVDLHEVTSELVKISQSPPAGLLPEFGGPEILTFEEMVENYLRINGSQQKWKPFHVPAPRWDLFRSGVNLVSENKAGKTKWSEFLSRLPL